MRVRKREEMPMGKLWYVDDDDDDVDRFSRRRDGAT